MRKIIPKNLDAELGPRLGCLLCIYDSTHIVQIHSYSDLAFYLFLGY